MAIPLQRVQALTRVRSQSTLRRAVEFRWLSLLVIALCDIKGLSALELLSCAQSKIQTQIILLQACAGQSFGQYTPDHVCPSI